jgi:hypothetical protein
MAVKLSADFRPEVDTIFTFLMPELERRMPLGEFCAFCDSL